MTRSAKGTVEIPGHNVKAKAGLNKTIVDQWWGELTRQRSYKQHWRSGILESVVPQYASQQCLE